MTSYRWHRLQCVVAKPCIIWLAVRHAEQPTQSSRVVNLNAMAALDPSSCHRMHTHRTGKVSQPLTHTCTKTTRLKRDTAVSATAAITQTAVPTTVAPIRLDPEVKAKHKRPADWVAPGPQPYGNPTGDPELVPQQQETLSFLTGDWRILQLQHGHRSVKYNLRVLFLSLLWCWIELVTVLLGSDQRSAVAALVKGISMDPVTT